MSTESAGTNPKRIIQPEVIDVVAESSLRVLDDFERTSDSGLASDVIRDTALSTYYAEGETAAVDLANREIDRLGVDEDSSFWIWRRLLMEGAQAAKPHALEVSGIASEQISFVEQLGIKLRGLHSAEHFVWLVGAGVSELTDLARGMTERTLELERPGLFSKLYQAGDEPSGDLLLQATDDAREHAKSIQQTSHLYRTDAALLEAGLHAASIKDEERALQMVARSDTPRFKGDIYAELHNQGFSKHADDVFSIAGDKPGANPYDDSLYLYRRLAQGGNERALDNLSRLFIKRRFHRQPQNVWNVDENAETLGVLYDHGYSEAGRQLVDTIERAAGERYGYFYLRYLGRSGLEGERLRIARDAFSQNKTFEYAAGVDAAEPTLPNWQRAFAIGMVPGSAKSSRLSNHILELARRSAV